MRAVRQLEEKKEGVEESRNKRKNARPTAITRRSRIRSTLASFLILLVRVFAVVGRRDDLRCKPNDQKRQSKKRKRHPSPRSFLYSFDSLIDTQPSLSSFHPCGAGYEYLLSPCVFGLYFRNPHLVPIPSLASSPLLPPLYHSAMLFLLLLFILIPLPLL